MLYTFFDVETPNTRNDRICSIGIVTTDENGAVEERSSFLVDPEARFDDVNMGIHGIAPIDVKGSPTIADLWDGGLRDLFSESRVVAHNAAFDLCAMSKALAAYGIAAPHPTYACTMDMARRGLPGLKDYRLPSVCSALGIDGGVHHRSIDDAMACSMAFWSLSGICVPSFAEYYARDDPDRPRSARVYSDKTEAVRWIKDAMGAAMDDGSVSIGEAMRILDFIASSDAVAGDPLVSRVSGLLQSAVMDGWIDEGESEELARVFEKVSDPTASSHAGVVFDGRKFVLTGSFEHGSKDRVAAHIASRGGEVVKGVTKTCDYVVVGGQGSEAYAMGNYGSKVKKALDWQAKGVPIEIVAESEIFGE